MITQDLYEIRLKEASLLLAQRVDREAARLTFERIRNSYTDADLTAAMDSCVDHEDRLNYPNIRRRLEEAKDRREELEWKEARRREEHEARLFWQGKTKSSIANDHARAIARICAAELKVEDAHRELMEKYPGIGHENYLPELDPF